MALLPRPGFVFEYKASSGLLVLIVTAIAVVRFQLLAGGVAALCFFASLLAHEAGHIVIARAAGVRISAVGLCMRGAYLRRERAQNGMIELCISAAGPLVNLLLAIWLWDPHPVMRWLAQINLALFIINMLPIGSSDGQRILGTLRQLRPTQTST
jgi:Zn-dependent protease